MWQQLKLIIIQFTEFNSILKKLTLNGKSKLTTPYMELWIASIMPTSLYKSVDTTTMLLFLKKKPITRSSIITLLFKFLHLLLNKFTSLKTSSLKSKNNRSKKKLQKLQALSRKSRIFLKKYSPTESKFLKSLEIMNEQPISLLNS